MRPKRLQKTVFLFLAILAATPVMAADKPEISVEIDEGEPKFIQKNQDISLSCKSDHAAGCMRSRFYGKMSPEWTKIKKITERTTKRTKIKKITFQWILKKIQLKIGLKDVEIELSTKYKKETCGFDLVLKHELTHLALHRAVLKRFAPEIAKAVLSVAEENMSGLSQQAQTDRINNVLNEYMERMKQEAARQDALMDSTESYGYQWKQCKQ